MLATNRCRARIILAALVLLMGVGGLSANPPSGKRYAVLVGVQQYDHAKLDPLDFAENDVRELADLLRPAGYEVTLLTGATGKDNPALLPTKANIDKQLKAVLTKCQKEDLVLVALAGHGLQFENKPEAFFCPKDARPLADRTDTLLSLDSVYEHLAASEALVKLLLVDACRNDPSGGRGRGVDANSLEKAPPKGVFAFYSCSAGERAFEHKELKHGVFFHYVLEGLKGEALDRDGEVTFESLALYVRKEVPKRVPKLVNPEAKQNPALRMVEASGSSPIIMSMTDHRLVKEMQTILTDYSTRLLKGDAEMNALAGVGREQVARWRQAAERGSRDGEYLYGICLWYGISVPINETAGGNWIRKAAERGNVRAVAEVGWMYAHGRGGVGKNEKEAVKWLRQAADAGDLYGQFHLGLLHGMGQGDVQDYTEAVKWYRKAAEQGHSVAQNNLGYAYANGRGLTKDETEAARWYRRAAEQGNAVAQINLGLVYEFGNGVAKDPVEAVKWYRKAADLGNITGQYYMGWCYEDGIGLQRDYSQAAKWYRKAADQGNASAQDALGTMYFYGRGIGKDEVTAFNWYVKSAENGFAGGQFDLGWMYAEGRGVAKDDREAARWYRKAADQGHAVAQNNLAVLYEDGRGVAKNVSEAIKWYRKAAAQGDEGAQKALRRLNANP